MAKKSLPLNYDIRRLIDQWLTYRADEEWEKARDIKNHLWRKYLVSVRLNKSGLRVKRYSMEIQECEVLGFPPNT